MDNAESEKLDVLIDRYLAGETTSSERDQFETVMKSDIDLARKVDLRKKMTAFFRRDGEQLVQILQDTGNKHLTVAPKKQSKVWIISLVLFLIFATSLVLINKSNKPQSQENNVPSVDPLPENLNPSLKAPQDTIPNEVLIPVETRPTSTPHQPEQQTEPRPNPPRPNPPRPNPPIAAVDPADFTPNPYLESLVEDQLRGNIQLTLNAPVANDTLSLDDPSTRILQGNVNTAGPFSYLIFDNSEERFLNDEPKVSGSLELINEGDVHSFKTQLPQDLESGLYYLLVLETASEDLVVIQRFYIR